MKRIGKRKFVILMGIIQLLFVALFMPTSIFAQNVSSHEEPIKFQGEGVMLNGTVLAPTKIGRHPAIVIVHGSGKGDRNKLRDHAEIFAKKGYVTLIYDKRTKGYSTFNRSYALLAKDVIAAVQALKKRPDVDPNKIGVFGESEGSWVAPLAATQSSEIKFVITLGAATVLPIAQQNWSIENMLRYQGITDQSMIGAVNRNGVRFIVGSSLFPEATYDAIPVLQRLKQPILAIWGSEDRQSPPAESAAIMKETFSQVRKDNYTLAFIPNADHAAHQTPDGFKRLQPLAQGYGEVMTSWLDQLFLSKKIQPLSGVVQPKQAFSTYVDAAKTHWYDSVQFQGALLLFLLIGFFGYGIRLRRHRQDRLSKMIRWIPRLVAITGGVATIGFVCFFFYIWIKAGKHIGPVLMGHSLVWLIIQIFTLVACLFSISLFFILHKHWTIASKIERIRLSLLTLGSILFAFWAAYWKLLFF
ncbi:hypothetical protein SAMN05444392_104145 [Seinonella peptonophila]|uniref:Peptidase S9 prolyl oligopeptidase catalytic domain-containing protein n=1 Tax=Seinonella peptonophila TaxID=112248 RepID=A0A1M4X620_9BACL|nr:prolyl oligopeptidase family serine peptidase [Seinonella peptonophila]SHE88930.1 hypothetical protein SAMN05444392_104145 [Seinonella peptonophila]